MLLGLREVISMSMFYGNSRFSKKVDRLPYDHCPVGELVQVSNFGPRFDRRTPSDCALHEASSSAKVLALLSRIFAVANKPPLLACCAVLGADWGRLITL